MNKDLEKLADELGLQDASRLVVGIFVDHHQSRSMGGNPAVG